MGVEPIPPFGERILSLRAAGSRRCANGSLGLRFQTAMAKSAFPDISLECPVFPGMFAQELHTEVPAVAGAVISAVGDGGLFLGTAPENRRHA